MKWTKIKSIILAFLLAMNIFMLIIIYVTTSSKLKIPENVVDSSVSILNKSGFEISRKDFPDSYYMLPSYNVTFYSAWDLSEVFFGKQVAFSTSGNSLIATNESAVLSVDGNHFIYNSGKNAKTHNSTETKKALEKAGIDMEGAVYDKEMDCFYRMYNDANLFNMSIQAKLDDNGEICYVNANWPKELIGVKKEKFSFLNCVTTLKEIFPEGGKISNIELGYSLQSVGGEKYTFVPAWRVKIDDELIIFD